MFVIAVHQTLKENRTEKDTKRERKKDCSANLSEMDFTESDGFSSRSAFMITNSLAKTMTASLVKGFDPEVSYRVDFFPYVGSRGVHTGSKKVTKYE